MKKRILSCLMALALCLTLLPTAALADEPADPANGETKQEQESQQGNQQENRQEQPTEEETSSPAPLGTHAPTVALAEDAAPHTHFLCGTDSCKWEDHTDEGKKTTFEKWLKSDSYVLWIAEGSSEDGKKLGQDSNNCWKLPAGTYYLSDGTEGSTLWISHPIVIDGEVTICLNGKTIQSTGAGAVFRVIGNGKLTLTDCTKKGKVQNDDYTSAEQIGSGVSVEGQYSKFTLYNGTICSNRAHHGGGVSVGDGEFTMYGGMICNNTTKLATGSYSAVGGGVSVYTNGTFNMHGGNITQNDTYQGSGGDGGGVFVSGYSTFNMTGGTITANTNKYGSCGVFVSKNSTFNVSGTPQITGNTWIDNYNKLEHGDVYLEGAGAIITVAGPLLGDASIGVVTKGESDLWPEKDKPVVIAKGSQKDGSLYTVKESDAEAFFSDRTFQHIEFLDGSVKLCLGAAHRHCLCGETTCNGRDGHSKQETEFIPWTDALAKAQNSNDKTASNSLPSKEGGKYYLTGDVTLTGTWTPAPNTVLCLNGHNITANVGFAAIIVNNAFTLCDCKGGKDAYGQITHAVDKTGSGVFMSGGVFHMYGGSITGNTANVGGGVYMAGDQFTMYGGNITGNTASEGGGVYVNKGCKFDMNGGTIGGTNDGDANTANQGGGVYVVGSLTMNGNASVTGNQVIGSDGNGGGVCVNGGTFTMNGNASVSGNTATDYGGGVYVSSNISSDAFTMNGNASITGNTAKNGGGVYASIGKFNMNDNASVMNNTATTDSGGVFVHWNATFTVSDRPTVTGNKNNDVSAK